MFNIIILLQQASEVSAEFQLIVEDMKKFKQEFDQVRILPDSAHDLNSFWLRKTKKPVLAVLLVGGSSNLFYLVFFNIYNIIFLTIQAFD